MARRLDRAPGLGWVDVAAAAGITAGHGLGHATRGRKSRRAGGNSGGGWGQTEVRAKKHAFGSVSVCAQGVEIYGDSRVLACTYK